MQKKTKTSKIVKKKLNLKTSKSSKNNSKISFPNLEKSLSFVNIKSSWHFDIYSDIPNMTECTLIGGLPGIGNVGKIAVDFLIDELKAERILSITSSSFPHSVFVNENNLVELPKIDIFFKKIKSKNYFFLSGDVQPPDETSCYEFSNMILEMMKNSNCKEVVTLGGMGLSALESVPKLYCTGNDKNIIKRYKVSKNISNKLYGVVGPIMGVSGILVGLSERYGIDAICILAETLNHPLYLGISSSSEIVKLLSKKFSFSVNTKKLDTEIKDLEANILLSTGLQSIQQDNNTNKKVNDKISYIG